MPTSSENLRPEALARALSEPADRIVVALWLIAAALAAVAATHWLGSWASRWSGRWVWVLAPGISLLVGSTAWHFDPGGRSPEIPVQGLAIGILGAIGLLVVLARGARWSSAICVAGVSASIGIYAWAWWQTPSRLHEPGHASYALDEMAAVASGHIPLVDYVSQYANLLGYPVAPVIRLLPEHATAISLGWILLLQLAAVLVAVAFVGWQSGRRALGVAALVVPTLLFAEASPGISASSYFAGTPLRVMLPIVLIAVAAVLVSHVHRGVGAPRWLAVLLGVLAGVATLNNPDFGGAAALAVLLGVLVADASWVARARSSALYVLGLFLPFVLYLIGTAASGPPAEWSDWLLYQRLFGSDGFFSVAMTAVGWHVALAVLFIASAAAGVVMVSRRRAALGARSARQGLALLMIGWWGVFTLPYFAGRSLPSTVIGGYALQIGWLVACLLPVAAAACRVLARSGHESSTVVGGALSVALVVLAAGFCVAGLLRVPSPGDVVNRPQVAFLTDQDAAIAAAIDSAPPDVRRAVARGRVQQVIAAPSLSAFRTGLGSASVFNTPEVFGLSDGFTRRQCQALAPGSAEYLVVGVDVAALLAAQERCRAVLRFSASRSIGVRGPDGRRPYVAIPFAS